MNPPCPAGAPGVRPSRRRPLRSLLFALCALALGAPAPASTPIGYAGSFREDIEATFFEAEGGRPGGPLRLSPDKLAAYREKLMRKRRFIEGHVAEYERIEKGKGRKRAARTARRTDVRLALKLALQHLERMSPQASDVENYDAAAAALTLDFATRSFTVGLSSLEIPKHVKNILSDWSVSASTSASGIDAEAGNLVNPADGRFYTRAELAELVRGGSDLSEVHPPDATWFWRRKPDISKVDVTRNYFEGGDPVHEGIVTRFPAFDGAVLDLEKVHLTQSKPKLDVTWVDPVCLAEPRGSRKRCERRVKLKFGMEVHADPPSNALLAALGFNVDVSMHMKNVRVNLGDTSVRELEKLWASYFDRQRLHIYYPLEKVLVPGPAGRGRDEEGDYLVFRHAVAEVKHPDIERVGFFGFSHGVAANAREARGLFVFNAWIANADMKDEENNKLSLRRDAAREWRIHLTQQDIGHSFGYILPEKVDWFPWDLVDQDPFSRAFGFLRNRIELTYIDLQDSGLEETTTYADAKWMVRLIAQLRREQIDEAVRLGHWPEPVARLYVEKLVHRRNQLVEAFGLGDEFAQFPVERNLTTPDGAVVEGELVQREWPDTHMRFGDHWRDLLVPVGERAAETALWGLQTGVGSIDRIDPGRFKLSGRLIISPELLLEIQRNVTLNPDPTGRFDQYIVRDSVALGTQVGVGFFGSAEGAYIKRFSLAYPVATRAEGLTAGNRLLSVLMPTDVRRGELPERYVLLREDAFAAGVRVSSDDSGELFDVLGGLASINKVVHWRSVLDHRGEVPVVWVDRPDYWRLLARAFLKAEVLEIPVAWGQIARGDIDGVAWRLDPDRLDTPSGDGLSVFERMVRFDDPSGLGAIQLEPPMPVRVVFDARRLRYTLYFLGADLEVRNHEVRRLSPGGEIRRKALQAERRTTTRWSFIDNGEQQTIAITAVNEATGAAGFEAAGAELIVRYRVDDLLAYSSEFDAYYDLLADIDVLRSGLAGDFDALDWEVSGKPRGRWVRLLTHADLRYGAEALARMLSLDPERYWPNLAAELGVAPGRVQRILRDLERAPHKLGRRAVSGATPRELRAIERSLFMFRDFARAARADDEAARLARLAAGLDMANFRTGPTFDACIVAALHRSIDFAALAERGQVSARGGITRATDDENNLPERRSVVGVRGGAESEAASHGYRFFPVTGLELYTMLDWLADDGVSAATTPAPAEPARAD